MHGSWFQYMYAFKTCLSECHSYIGKQLHYFDIPKYEDRKSHENSAVQDQTAPLRSSLILVCTVFHITSILDTMPDSKKQFTSSKFPELQ